MDMLSIHGTYSYAKRVAYTRNDNWYELKAKLSITGHILNIIKYMYRTRIPKSIMTSTGDVLRVPKVIDNHWAVVVPGGASARCCLPTVIVEGIPPILSGKGAKL